MAATLATTELGVGAPVMALGDGFANSAAHQALARRFRVIVIDTEGLAPEAAGRAVADWAAAAGLEGVGFLGLGGDAAAALWAAQAAGEGAKSVVLVSPQGLPVGGAPANDETPAHLLTQVSVPKAVLIGSRDSSQPKEALSLYKRALSRSHVVLVYGAGADVAGDRPDAFADAAGDFFDRQGRFNFMTESVALLPG
jgi:pimeloyl-ACP methyl ester carboxylesterase